MAPFRFLGGIGWSKIREVPVQFSVIVGNWLLYCCLLWFSGGNPTTSLLKFDFLLPFQRQPRVGISLSPTGCTRFAGG